MFKNKRNIITFSCVFLILFLTGCSSLDLNMFVDDKSNRVKNAKDYLKVGAKVNAGSDIDANFKLETLQLGNISENGLTQRLKRSYLNTPIIRLSLDGIKAQFGEYIADNMQYVNVGDVIATVYTEVDDIAIKEAQIKLERLNERYEAASQQTIADLEKITEDKKLVYNDYKKNVMDIEYKQRQLDWEFEKYNFECEIEKAKENIATLTKIGSVYEIKATSAGYVNYKSTYQSGKSLDEGAYICHILKCDDVYVVIENQAEFYHYNMDVTFDCTLGTLNGKTVTGGAYALYGNLDKKTAAFKLDITEELDEQKLSSMNNLTMKGILKSINNVVLVPKAAVTVENKGFYVTVLNKDGSLVKTEFIPGGSNSDYYWVMDGLNQGMQIVYN